MFRMRTLRDQRRSICVNCGTVLVSLSFHQSFVQPPGRVHFQIGSVAGYRQTATPWCPEQVPER